MGSILIISPVPTHPASAGNRARMASLVNLLKTQGHTVWFMHVEQEPGDREKMRESMGDCYIPVPYEWPEHRIRRFIRRVAKRLGHPSAYNFGVDEWYDAALDPHLDHFFRTRQVDAVIVEYVFLSRALLRVPAGVRKLIDTHDVFTDRYRRYLDQGISPAWFSCSATSEARGLSRADAVIAIQTAEADYFRKLQKRDVVVVGHSVRLDPLPAEAIVPGRVLFIGSGNTVNLSAYAWLTTDVMPEVRLHCPNASLVVCGSISRHITPDPQVEVLGEIDDLATVYATAHVVVNPVQVGTGLKIKSVECLGFGRALVTTPCGAEGIESGAGSAYRLATTAEEFAVALVDLLRDPLAARTLGGAAHEFARFFNSHVADELLKLLPNAP